MLLSFLPFWVAVAVCAEWTTKTSSAISSSSETSAQWLTELLPALAQWYLTGRVLARIVESHLTGRGWFMRPCLRLVFPTAAGPRNMMRPYDTFTFPLCRAWWYLLRMSSSLVCREKKGQHIIRGVARILGKGELNRLTTPTNYVTCLHYLISNYYYYYYYYYGVVSKYWCSTLASCSMLTQWVQSWKC